MRRSANVAPVVAILLGSVLSPVFSARIKFNQSSFVPDDPLSDFSKTFTLAKSVLSWSRVPLLKTACDSSAFTCEQIIQFADFEMYDNGWAADTIMLFAEGRSNKGCISDPDNAQTIVDFFETKWGEDEWVREEVDRTNAFEGRLGRLKEALINNEVLEPAKAVRPPPMQLPQTGLRTDEDMKELLKGMDAVSFFGGNFFNDVPFEKWLKQITAHGEQFSGPQLVELCRAVPRPSDRDQVFLLEYLEQYVTGVTCKEVAQILPLIMLDDWRARGLAALKGNIVDGQNKVEVFAAHAHRMVPSLSEEAEEMLRDVGGGIPPKNNPVFGLVKGNPVILVVDESSSMDTEFALGGETFTRREFCRSQLETVLEGLPDGTYFNVIQYSSSAVKVFQEPVLVSKTNIDAAMERASWRPCQQNQHRCSNGGTNSMDALQLAYATAPADLPSRRTDGDAHNSTGYTTESAATTEIYFLTGGQPDGGAGPILDKIDEFDQGRKIPVHSIAFSMPGGDPVAKQFVKDLATKTGGFFRSIEQHPEGSNQ